MSDLTPPVSHSGGRALIIGSLACRALPMQVLGRLDWQCTEADDPYTAMAELCRRPLAYRSAVLSLNSLYREELQLIAAVKHRYPHIDIWLSQTDGRAAALADATRLGADGLISEEGLHRFSSDGAEPEWPSVPSPSDAAATASSPEPEEAEADAADDAADAAGDPSEPSFLDLPSGEPILTADELKALLQEQPAAREMDKDGPDH